MLKSPFDPCIPSRVTKASSSIAVALLLISSGASATECRSSPGHDGKWWSYRIVDSKAMLVSGQSWPLQEPVALGQAIAAASCDPPGPRRQPAPCTASPAAAAHRDRHTEGGLDRVDPGADEQGAADGRAPAVFARAATIACQADEAVEVVDAALDHSSHRDRAGGRRITVSQKTVDELAGTAGRPSRSDGGQHHAVVTPRVEASPDRYDFAKLGETKQFADDIRSQVAEKSRELISYRGLCRETPRKAFG